MQNFVKHGKTVRFTAGSDLSAGDLVQVGKYNLVVQDDVLSGAEGIGDTEGVFELTKVAPLVIAQGDVLYLDTGELTNVDSGSLPLIGLAHVAALSADILVQCDIQRDLR